MTWFGNAAKMRIIERITGDGTPKVVFDYGAGRGAGWPDTLVRHPEITLVAYEPSPASAAVFKRSLPDVQLFEGEADALSVNADIAVSFSVFEHVADRAAYLRHARRCLKPGATFFLNYDDGHFREPGNALDALRNRIAPILPRIGLTRYYQATVRKADAHRMVAEAGFRIIADRYENLASMKALARTIAPDARPAFARLWLDLEDRLNAEFVAPTSFEFHGDRINLWREMGSRTLELQAV